MLTFAAMNAQTDIIAIADKEISLHIRREDLLHPLVPGNKLRKLKYNLIEANAQGQTRLLTFGGAFSNHIAAVAQAGKLYRFETVGVIRGEELSTAIDANPTLLAAQNCGMKLKFVSRESFRNKEQNDFIEKLKSEFGLFYLLPEGGTNSLAVKGCEEILTGADADFDYICCAAGTGGTAAGIANSAAKNQRVLVFPALKGNFLDDEIRKHSGRENWRIISDYHFGGYAKVDRALIEFINDFGRRYKILLDPVYTGKMLFGVMDLISKDYFAPGSKILAIHTGGIQGIKGMNNKLIKNNLPIIEDV